MSSTIIESLRQRKTLMTTTEVMETIPGFKARWRLCQRVREGKLRAYLLSSGYAFDPADVADYIEARQIGADRPRKAA